MDAYWRAANYLSVGQIYLYDNPPDFRKHAVAVPAPGDVVAQDTRVRGLFLRDLIAINQEQRATRPSSASSIRCSASTPSGSR